jgi:hypothetical protein
MRSFYINFLEENEILKENMKAKNIDKSIDDKLPE